MAILHPNSIKPFHFLTFFSKAPCSSSAPSSHSLSKPLTPSTGPTDLLNPSACPPLHLLTVPQFQHAAPTQPFTPMLLFHVPDQRNLSQLWVEVCSWPQVTSDPGLHTQTHSQIMSPSTLNTDKICRDFGQ